MSGCTLPSIAEIRKSTEKLSPPDASATVVKVGDNFAVKFGPGVSFSEAASLDYVSTHSDIPVPKVFGTLTDSETRTNFIIMEFVQGAPLGTLWASLSPPERFDIGRQIQAALSSLRSLQPPGYIGSVNRQACADGVFWVPDKDPAVSGPFENENEMNEAMLRRLAETEPASHLSLLRTLISATLKGHKTVFTHGDLQPKNIMVHRTGEKEDGVGIFEVKIVDWENSGWYPEYWEFCNSTIAGRFRPEWLELVQRIMPIYSQEYLMMQTIRSLLFY